MRNQVTKLCNLIWYIESLRIMGWQPIRVLNFIHRNKQNDSCHSKQQNSIRHKVTLSPQHLPLCSQTNRTCGVGIPYCTPLQSSSLPLCLQCDRHWHFKCYEVSAPKRTMQSYSTVDRRAVKAASDPPPVSKQTVSMLGVVCPPSSNIIPSAFPLDSCCH
jgi:hypothetical protein